MRPIHLWIAVLALAIVVFGLWRFVAGGPSVHALAAGSSAADGAGGGARSDLAAATAAERDDARDEGRAAAREAAVVAGAAEAADLASAAPAEERDVVTGRVVDREGRPVPDALVYGSSRRRHVRIPLDVEPDGLGVNWLDVVTATTDAAGRYELADLAGDELALVVRARGFAPSRREGLRVRERDGRRELEDAVLAPGAVCTGRVVDPRGQGVGGVRIVQAVDGRGGTGTVVLGGRGIPLGESAADGSFRVDELGPGPFSLSFDAPGFRVAEKEGRADPGAALGGWVVVLDYGDAIAGRVESVDGARPIPAERLATLRVSARAARERNALGNFGAHGADEAPEEQGPTGDDRARHGAFDDEGKFAITGLVPGAPYRLTVWEPELDDAGAVASWSRLDAFQPTSARGGDRGVLLEHRPQSELAFRVVDDATGEPIEELGVWVGVGRKQPLRDDERKAILHHPGGRVVCPNLRLKVGGPAVGLTVVAPGYVALVRDELRIAPGESLDLGDLRLVRAPELVVTVLAEESGEPLEGARVALSYTSERELAGEHLGGWLGQAKELVHHSPDVLFARSDASGRAVLGARAGESGLLVATADGRLACEPVRVAMPGDGTLAQEVRLRRGGTVVVRVRDDAGDPVEGVAVLHRAPGADQGGEHGGWSSRHGGRGGEESDEAGELRYEALEPGVHGFRLSDVPSGQDYVYYEDDEEQAPAPSWTEVVVVGAGEAAVDLVAPARGKVAGTVLESGTPLQGASVQLVPLAEEGARSGAVMFVGGLEGGLSSIAGDDGAFEIDDVPAGVYELAIAHASRRMPYRREVTVGKGLVRVDVDLSLTQIEGRVVGADGRPLEGIDITVAGAGLPHSFPPMQVVVAEDDRGSLQMRYDQRASANERTDAQGRYTLRGVVAGTPLTVYARGETVVSGRAGPFDLGEGELRRGVDFRLDPAGAIQVELAGEPSTAQYSWFRVDLRRTADEEGENAQRSSTVLSSWQRKRVVGSLAPGHWTLELKDGRRSGEVLQTLEVDVRAGERHEVRFRL